ncbi:hypothetical protein [Bacillus suaedaesalsae]|uniref:Uncharacterized protein n=1 Tax=Bacillus suaedaesalsae TaxID=2810349 RepID=A0ABS2DLG0_9BACI|nr:hypothetical protein [Bacillus suaedaesalsae]MBM6619313.1 hypothetical protein [Bacillus suaedaesalsae]
MSSYTITTKKKQFDLSKFLIMTSIILVFSCIFLPFVVIYTYQDIFISNHINGWFFTTPNSNYAIFAGSLFWFAIVMILYLIYRNRMLLKGKKVKHLLFLILAFPGAIAIILSLNHYFYLDNQGIHYNEFWGVGTETFKWQDVTHAEQLQVVRNGVMVEGDLVFTYQNGEVFHMPVTKDVQLNKRRIYTELRKVNVEVKRTLPDSSEVTK